MSGGGISNFVNKAVGVTASPALAPFAYLGGLEAHGFKGGARGASAVVRDPRAYFSTPQGRGQFAAGVGTVAAAAGGAALAPTAGTGTVAGWTSGGAAIEGQVLTAGGIASAAGGAGAGLATGALALHGADLLGGPQKTTLPDPLAPAADPANPDLSNVVRQRQRRGRAGTILTAGQSLGSTPGGKTLLGL